MSILRLSNVFLNSSSFKSVGINNGILCFFASIATGDSISLFPLLPILLFWVITPLMLIFFDNIKNLRISAELVGEPAYKIFILTIFSVIFF